jgi:hemerythrin
MLRITDDMKTGIPEIDEQHLELVDRINAVTAMGAKSASKEETEKTLDFLAEYVIKHFNDEETLQKKSNYPEYEHHANEHKKFIAEFQKLMKRFHAEGPSTLFTLTLNNTAIAWVVRHIKGEDRHFGNYYTTNK